MKEYERTLRNIQEDRGIFGNTKTYYGIMRNNIKGYQGGLRDVGKY